jgi:hypothetical protein
LKVLLEFKVTLEPLVRQVSKDLQVLQAMMVPLVRRVFRVQPEFKDLKVLQVPLAWQVLLG